MIAPKDKERFEKILASASAFAELNPEEIQSILEACELKVLAPREALWAVGGRGEAAFILIEGKVEQTERHPPDGHRVNQYNRPGTLLGLSYLVKGWRHQSAASAMERTTLLRLTRDRFEAMFEAGDPGAFALVDEIAEDLVQEMRDANRRLHEVFGNPAETLRTLRRRVRQM